MKKLILLLVLIIAVNTYGNAQGLGPAVTAAPTLTPLKELNNDRMAFIKQNFEHGNRRYMDKYMSVFFDDMEKEHPFYFVLEKIDSDYGLDAFVCVVYVFFYTKDEMKRLVREEKELWGVSVRLVKNIYESNPLYKELDKMGIRKMLKWNRKKYYSVLKDLIFEFSYVSDFSTVMKSSWKMED